MRHHHEKMISSKKVESATEAIQRKSVSAFTPVQGPLSFTDMRTNSSPVIQPQKNTTGLPDNLKSGLENLSGLDLSHVKVHRNSSRPAQLQALAYAQGNEIHLGPGQEKHLPHEGWHVVQQMQGRVKPTLQMKGNVFINDNPFLEREADVMGTRALSPDLDKSVAQRMHKNGPPQHVFQLQGDELMNTIMANAWAYKWALGLGLAGLTGGLILYNWWKSKNEPLLEALTKGLEKKTNQAKVDEIFRRLNKASFTYTGSYTDSNTAFQTRQGDCRTLCGMFQVAAKKAGVKDVKLKELAEPMLVAPLKIHGRNKTGNLEGENFWFFENHYWCQYQGQVYDLLFMQKSRPTYFHLVNTLIYKGVKYMLFSNDYCVIDASSTDLVQATVKGVSGICVHKSKVKPYISNQVEINGERIRLMREEAKREQEEEELKKKGQEGGEDKKNK